MFDHPQRELKHPRESYLDLKDQGHSHCHLGFSKVVRGVKGEVDMPSGEGTKIFYPIFKVVHVQKEE